MILPSAIGPAGIPFIQYIKFAKSNQALKQRFKAMPYLPCYTRVFPVYWDRDKSS